MLATIRPDILFDVAVPAARRDVAIAGLEAGCHVLTEKPLAASLEDARTILATAKACGRQHAVVQNRRYLGAVRRLQRFLRSGALGPLTSLHADFFLGPHFGGFREAMDHVLLLDMAIHTFDVARLLAGSRPTSVYCREWQPAGDWYHSGSSAAAIFEFESGIPFTYRGSWSATGLRTSWESSWRFVCERGSVTWDGFDGLRAEKATGARDGLFDAVGPVEIPELDPSDRIGGHKGVIEDFLAAIAAGEPPETTGTDNFLSLAMVFGAIASAEAHASVAIPELGVQS
ncbi:MAG: Gfo/Idh/MocA family oxidoreductase, partial [Ancalomicrobiaceae bacterium]|nr:Gfo/Idh/MocA family oxidoreductase [Ancalomicrobiaceae bacterium]